MSGPAAAVALLPWRGWRRPGVAWRRAPGLLLMLLAPAVAALAWGLTPRATLAAFGLALLAWAWWRQAGGLLRQDRPALAGLVPGQARVLHASLVLQAALVVAAGSLLLRAGLGAGPEATAWVALAVLAAIWLQREPWLWLPLSFAPMLPLPWRAGVLAVTAWPLVLQGAAAAGLVLAALAALGRGGHRHLRREQRRQGREAWARAAAEGRPLPLALSAPWVRGLARPFVWPLALRRRWLLRHAGPGNALARLELGLQTGGSWPLVAWVMALVLGTLGIALAAAVQLAGWRLVHVVDGSHIGLCLGLFSALLSPAMGRAAALWGRRPEQALLVLLPGPPAGAALTAALMTSWRRGQLAGWAVATAAVLAITPLGSPGSPQFAAGFAAGCLPLLWWTQHRQSRLRAAPGPLEPWLAGPLLATVPGLLAEWLAVPAPVSLALGGAAAAACAWGLRAPPRALLPTGRGQSAG